MTQTYRLRMLVDVEIDLDDVETFGVNDLVEGWDRLRPVAAHSSQIIDRDNESPSPFRVGDTVIDTQYGGFPGLGDITKIEAHDVGPLHTVAYRDYDNTMRECTVVASRLRRVGQ